MAKKSNVLDACVYLEKEKVWFTPRGRMSFVALSRRFVSANAKPDKDGKTLGKYAVELSFSPEVDLSLINEAANAKALEKGFTVDFLAGKNKVKVEGKMVSLKNPFLPADEKLADVTSKGVNVELEGWRMIRTSSKQRQPQVRNAANELLDADDVETEAYPGRWARIMVRPYWYTVDGNSGVAFGLEGAQILRHDDKIGSGGAVNSEAFGAVDDEDEDDDV
jgi:hypothetical protein